MMRIQRINRLTRPIARFRLWLWDAFGVVPPRTPAVMAMIMDRGLPYWRWFRHRNGVPFTPDEHPTLRLVAKVAEFVDNDIHVTDCKFISCEPHTGGVRC